MAKKKFKVLGSSILEDILGDAPINERFANAPLHKAGSEQLHSSGAAEICNEDVRLHVYISQELEDLLLNEVYSRKRDKDTPNNKASKRAVVEDALGCFFYRNRNTRKP